MTMTTLYEEIFEGRAPRKCEDCMHYDACHEFSQTEETNPNDCEHYEEEKTLYEDIFGKEE